jgi:translocation and assembly module TamB
VDAAVSFGRSLTGGDWQANGTATINRGRVFDVEVSELRLPFTIATAPTLNQGRAEFRDASAWVARGRVEGAAKVSWGANSRVDGHLRFYDLDMPTLQSQLHYRGAQRDGRISGRIDFGGNDVRSIDELSVTLDATLHSNRVIHLVGTGTVRNPSMRVESVSLLPERPLRSLANRLNRLVP